MPELPEVETVVVGLKRLLVGHSILSVTSDNPKSFPNPPGDVDQFVINSKIKNVRRKAKTIIIELSSHYSLIIHLKMTGQLVYVPKGKGERFGAGHPSDSLVDALPDKTTRVTLALSDGANLYFNDMRKFGWMRLYPNHAIDDVDFIQRLGPDALDVSTDEFADRISARSKSIKACLLDQTIIAGCGNIYADESLWASKIHPATPANKVKRAKLKELHKNLQDILLLSIIKGGSSNKNYVDAEGKLGSYMDFANVYMRAGKSCNRCQNEIERIVVATRGTHICSHCQPKPKLKVLAGAKK